MWRATDRTGILQTCHGRCRDTLEVSCGRGGGVCCLLGIPRGSSPASVRSYLLFSLCRAVVETMCTLPFMSTESSSASRYPFRKHSGRSRGSMCRSCCDLGAGHPTYLSARAARQRSRLQCWSLLFRFLFGIVQFG